MKKPSANAIVSEVLKALVSRGKAVRARNVLQPKPKTAEATDDDLGVLEGLLGESDSSTDSTELPGE